MDEPTHIPKKILVNGKEKVVYVRTEETEKGIDDYRMGPFAKIKPLPLRLFGENLKSNNLIISTTYLTAHRAIRTRLELDRRYHKVLTGATLIQKYFFDNEECRGGFPSTKQLYLLFGYSEVTNRRLHEIITETLFTRYQADGHFWMLVPKNLEAMALQWGESLLNLKMFPQLMIEPQEVQQGPVSVANPTTTTAVKEQTMGEVYRDPSYPEEPDEFAAPRPISDDPTEDRRRKRDRDKWRRK